VPNFINFVASIAELAHGEKSHIQSLNHPAYSMHRKLGIIFFWNNKLARQKQQ